MGEILENSLTEMDWLLQLNGFNSGDSDVQTEIEVKQEDIDSSPRVHAINYKVKPPYSYTFLITSAISSTSRKRMALSEIYQWIKDNYPYYKTAAPGWKNSVRHNLSLNKNFVKVARRKDEPGKGSYWALSSFVTKDLNHRTQQQQQQQQQHLPGFNELSYNNKRLQHLTRIDYETDAAIESINNNISQSSSLSDELLECEDVISEVELAQSMIDSQHNADISQHVEWLKNSCNGKLGTSWSSTSNIDLDLLMESLKAVESAKGKFVNSESLCELSGSFLSSCQPTSVKFICRSPPPHNNISQNYSELQPLTLPSNITDCDQHNNYYGNVRSSSPLPPYVLDHTEVVTSTCQLPPISLCSKYPQRTVAVVSRHKSFGVPTNHRNVPTQHNEDDDIDDDFNWDNLIAKDTDAIQVCVS